MRSTSMSGNIDERDENFMGKIRVIGVISGPNHFNPAGIDKGPPITRMPRISIFAQLEVYTILNRGCFPFFHIKE